MDNINEWVRILDSKGLGKISSEIKSIADKIAALEGTSEVFTAPSMEYVLQNTKPATGDDAKSEDPVMVNVTKVSAVYKTVSSLVDKFRSELRDLLEKYDEEVAITQSEEGKKRVKEEFVREKARLVRATDSLISKKFVEVDAFLKRQ